MSITADIPQYRQGREVAESTREMTMDLIRERVARQEYVVNAQAVAGAILERLLAVNSASVGRARG